MQVLHHPSNELWLEISQRSPEATFFHTPAWAEIITRTFPEFEIATKAFELDDGKFALIPAVATTERNRFFKWVESLYLGGYGGLIAERDLEPAETEALYRKALNWRVANFHLIGNPFSNHFIPSNFSVTSIYTHVINLTTGYEQVFQGFKNEKKRGIKKASNLGIEIFTAQTEEDYRRYFEIYQDTLARWGDSTLVTYTYELFQNIYLQHSPNIRLWLARLDGEIICGKLVFYHNQAACYWHGATKAAYLPTNADPYLMSRIIADACQQDLDFLDMGASGGLAGVESYKERFGAQKQAFNSYSWHSNLLYNTYKRPDTGS